MLPGVTTEDQQPEFTEKGGDAIDVFTVCADFILHISGWAVPLHVLGEIY